MPMRGKGSSSIINADGVTIWEVNQSLADSFELSKPEGALVSAVEKGSPAGKAGVAPGDVIVMLNGKALAASTDLLALLADARPGSAARLELVRKGVHNEVQVAVGTLKEPKAVRNASDQTGKGRSVLCNVATAPASRRLERAGRSPRRYTKASERVCAIARSRLPPPTGSSAQPAS